MNKFKNVLIIGAGSWGTALAFQIARTHENVELLCRNQEVMHEILTHRTNSKYLGNIKLPDNIIVSNKLDNLSDKQVVIIAVPSRAFSNVLYTLKSHNLNDSTVLLVATKGLSSNPTELLSEKIRSLFNNPIAFISGPNFAKEVAENLLTYATIAAENLELAKDLAVSLMTERFIIEQTDDLVTIQVAGAIKNIIAIKSGMYEALGYQENAKAGLVTEGLKEIKALSKVLGGKTDSLIDSAVVGDLILTCYSKTSRNTKFGYELGLNLNNTKFLDHYPDLVEGIYSTQLVIDLMYKHNIDLPVVHSVAKDLKYTRET